MIDPKRLENEVYAFGDFRFDVSGRRLTRAGEEVALTPKAFDLLCVLVRNAGRAVPRAELMDAVWRDTIVEEGNLAWNIKALRRALPDPDASIVETVRGFGYRFALPVRRETAAQRPVDPVSSPASSRAPAERTAPARARRAILLATGAAVLAVALALLYARDRPTDAPSRLHRAGEGTPTIAVLPPENLSADPAHAWIANAIREVLSSELAAGERVTSVAGETVAQALDRRPIASGGPLAAASLALLSDELGADLVVVGSYLETDANGSLRLDLHVQEVDSGRRVGGWSGTGDARDLIGLLARAGAGLRPTLGGAELAGPSPAAAAKASNEALRVYSDGIAHRHANRLLQAKETLEQAIAAAPTFAPAQAELAQVLTTLGYESRAAEVARRAVELSAGLPREERWRVEAQAAEAAEQWARAAQIWSDLTGLFPNNLDYGLANVRALSLAGRHDDAQRELARLDALPAPKRDDPRIEVERGWAARRAGDFSAMHRAGTRAVEIGRSRRIPLIEAQGRRLQAWADLTLHKFERGIPECEEAERLAAQLANGRIEASAIGLCSYMRAEMGETAAAASGFRRALGVARRHGSQSQIAGNLIALSTLATDGGRLSEACSFASEALDIASAAGQSENEADGYERLVRCTRLRGDLLQATELAGLGVERAVASGIATRIAFLQSARGRVLLDRGDGRAASLAFRKAGEALQTTELGSSPGLDIDSGWAALANHEMEAARAHAERASASEPLEAALLALAIAERTADLERLPDLLSTIEQETPARAPAALLVRIALARSRALSRLGKIEPALRELQGLDRQEWSEFGLARLEAALLRAELRPPGDRPGADAALESVRERIRSAHYGFLIDEAL